jgi:aminoglycoside 2'-N-acetyltransferase I
VEVRGLQVAAYPPKRVALHALAPDDIRATADDALFVRPVTARLDPAMPLVCDWRDGDVW